MDETQLVNELRDWEQKMKHRIVDGVDMFARPSCDTEHVYGAVKCWGCLFVPVIGAKFRRRSVDGDLCEHGIIYQANCLSEMNNFQAWSSADGGFRNTDYPLGRPIADA